MKKLLTAGLILGIFTTGAFANYNKGFKYYSKYIKHKLHLKSTVLIKDILKVQTIDELDKYVENPEKLEEALKQYLIKKGWDKEEVDKYFKSKAWKKIVKHKKDLKDFLEGIMEGKIPAGCS